MLNVVQLYRETQAPYVMNVKTPRRRTANIVKTHYCRNTQRHDPTNAVILSAAKDLCICPPTPKHPTEKTGF